MRAPTVSIHGIVEMLLRLTSHLRLVEDDQVFVSQCSTPYIAVAVMLYAKKFRPDTVTESPTDVAMFTTVATDVS
jgi:hypothetical protein